MLKSAHNYWFVATLFAVAIACTPLVSHAASGFEDEDTILVEKQPSQKIPYSKIIRKIGKRLFNFDTIKITQFGADKKRGVARNFGDFLDRSKYRVNVKSDKVVLKFTMNF